MKKDLVWIYNLNNSRIFRHRISQNIIIMNEDFITYQIRGAIFETYNSLGPGLLESVYEEALTYFLNKRDLKVERQVSVPIIIDGKRLATDLKLDILVENQIIIELKSVVEMKEVFHLQLLTYLKLSKLHRGILVNFNTSNIGRSIWNKVNGYKSEMKFFKEATESPNN